MLFLAIVLLVSLANWQTWDISNSAGLTISDQEIMIFKLIVEKNDRMKEETNTARYTHHE